MSMKKMRGQESCDWLAWGRYGLRFVRLLSISVLAGSLAACAQRQTMYSWNAYQPEVYEYLKANGSSDYAKQAQALEKNVEEARSQNKPLPPGFRAQLGMLYLNLGEGDRAVKEIEGEKLAFPESASFMDFLLRNTKKPNSTEQSTLQDDKTQPIRQKTSVKENS